MKHYVYILECADGTLYTGITNNLERRLAQHKSGRGARYTRGRLPLTLVYHAEVGNIKSAMKQERKIRRLRRAQKLELIQSR